MNAVYVNVLLLLDSCLHWKDIDIPSELWSQVFDELNNQAVACLPAEIIAKTELPSELKLAYMRIYGSSIQYFHYLLDEHDRLFDLFKEADISVTVLKGIAAAINYPTPERRSMGDIDLIVTPSNFNDAVNLLKNNGYFQESTIEMDERHISFKSSSGIEIELHNYYSDNGNEAHGILDKYIYEGLNNLIDVNLCGHNYKFLPTVTNGLVLLYHINHHISRGLGLRQIIDWQMFVEKYLTDELWTNNFSVAAEMIGLKRLAIVTTAMCKKYLGLDNSITWCDDVVDDKYIDDFIEYIMLHGNFGRKDIAKSKTVTVFRISRNPITFFKSAQKGGERLWPALIKYPWLKPFAWLYQIFRWLLHGIESGIKPSELREVDSKERRETELLKELGVTKF